MKKEKLFFYTTAILGIVAMVGGIFVLCAEQKERKERAMWEDAKVVLYDGPKSLRDATPEDLENASENGRDFSLLHCTDTTITVNGEECYVYDTNVNHTRQWVSNYCPPISRTPMAYFDFEGRAKITVTLNDRELEDVSVLPSAYGIVPEVDKEKNTVSFVIEKPDAYTLQFNHSPERAVHIFANPLETDIPDFNDPNVIVIEPGEWNVDSIMLKKGQTLYLSGGSVVHGIVNANFEKDIKVCGRGILDGSQYEGWKGTDAHIPLKFDHCSNIAIQDIIVLNSNAWVCQAYDSTDGVIDGLKIISPRPNGDGITLQSCQNYEVTNCFVRSWDDSLVVKNYDQNTENVHFSNIQLWTDLAQSMEIGYETNKGNKPDAAISNVSFENITVLNNFHKPVISVHNGDDAKISDILFKDIVVEHEEIGSGDGSEMPYLIDINIMQNSNWSTTVERGTVDAVSIENVSFKSGTENKIRIQGYDAEHKVTNIHIKDLNLFGKKVSSLENSLFEIDAATTENIILE